MNLQRFCSRDETRSSIMHPFSQGGYVYATDGRILVRLDCGEDYPEQSSPKIEGNGFPFDHDKINEEDWIPVPRIEPPSAEDICKKCRGRGHAIVRCEYCGEEHECTWCKECKGTGARIGKYAIPIGHAHFAANYLRLLHEELPGAVIEKNCPKEDMSRFRCGDVLGYLMPVRVE